MKSMNKSNGTQLRRETVRAPGPGAARLPGPGRRGCLHRAAGPCYTVYVEAIQVVARVGRSPLELTEWPTMLVEGFQACDIVERQRRPDTRRNLPVEVGDAS